VDSQVLLFMVGEALRLGLATVFVLAAYHAMRVWTLFGGIVEQYRVAPRWLARLAARILPPLELVVAVCLVLPATSRVGATLGMGLLALFTVAIAINVARGRVSIDCGCGGANGQKLSRALVVRNLIMMLGLALAWAAPDRGFIDAATAIGIMGLAVTLTVLYFAANQLMTNFQASHPPGTRTLP
jgi:Methylamine utilisation protein MauE